MDKVTDKKITDEIYALGNRYFPSFLIIGEKKIAQIDSGIAFMGPHYLDDLKKILGDGKGADLLFFTHSHFDHLGGAPYLMNRFPKLSVAGPEYLFYVLGREGARKTIERLNRDISKIYDPESELSDEDFDYSRIRPGLVVADGDIIDLGGGITIEVIATPGHTRDSVTYFLPHIKTVICGEDFFVAPEFLSSYEDYVESIKKVRKKSPEMILTGHSTIVKSENIESYFDRALKDTKAFKEKIEKYLEEEDMDEDSVVRRIKDEEFIPERMDKQPEEAYLLNLTAQVGLIAKKLRGGG